ncbi:MAG: hypothetical protein JWL97_3720 [Gemmatimonadales bacterium]|nr:hypothetical protein [Gemmatimonadales bacterium]
MSKDNVYTGIEKALFLLSRGHCYEPKCQVPVLQVIKGEPFVNVQIAHICAEEEKGPRYDEAMTREERRSFSNLMLLCKPHHTMIDRMSTVQQYPVSLLRKWKKSREGDAVSLLNGIGGLTEERLQELMADAVTEARQEVVEVVDLLTSVGKETVEMVRSLALEAFDRPYIPTLDLDAVASLERSARMLVNLPDDAPLLARAAEELSDLETYSGNLRYAADMIDWSALRGAAGSIQELSSTIDQLPRMSSGLGQAAQKIERAAAELGGSTPPVIQVDDQQRWLYFKVGVGLGVAVILLIVWLIYKAKTG